MGGMLAAMCGIIGYVGDREAQKVIMGGLRRMEYRGYDSAGIAVIDAQGHLDMRKRAGKLQVLLLVVAHRHHRRLVQQRGREAGAAVRARMRADDDGVAGLERGQQGKSSAVNLRSA